MKTGMLAKIVGTVILYQGWGLNCTTLLVQQYCFLPRPLCSCLRRLKLTMCCADNFLKLDPSQRIEALCTNNELYLDN